MVIGFLQTLRKMAMVFGKMGYVHIELIFWMRVRRIWDVIWIVYVDLSIGRLEVEGICSSIAIWSVPHILPQFPKSILTSPPQGISRSASITIAYLIRNHGMTFETAHA